VGYAEQRKRGLAVKWAKGLLIQGVLFISMLAGCATQMVYPYPDESLGSNTNRLIAVARIDDQRIDRDFDKVITTNPLDELSDILKKELESTGLFDKVVVMPASEAAMAQDQSETPINFIMNPTLVEIRLDDSQCKSNKRAAGLIGLVTFGFGAIPFWFTDCETSGYLRLHIAVKGASDEQLYIDKFYSGQTNQKVNLLVWGFGPNSPEVVAKSIKDVMNQLKADLATALK
jgi:hypothetical protein